MKIFLTGGTGFLGTYIAEACVRDGHALRALVVPGCDTARLEQLGAEIVWGDLADRKSLREGLDGCDVLIHAAAKVGDWGSWKEFYETNVAGGQRLYDAAIDARVGRAVQISSTAVYGKQVFSDGIVDESLGPLAPERMPKWYHYGRTKSLTEMMAMDYHARGRIQVSVIRPAWIYGPRDHKNLGRLLRMIQQGRARCVGDGSNMMMLAYAGNVADAVLLAATHDAAIGESFNVSNDPVISQRQYLDTLADMVGVETVPKSVAFRTAFALASVMELAHRTLRIQRRPFITRQAISLVGLSQLTTTDKITNRLGWRPRVDFPNAVERIRDWWRKSDAQNLRRAELALHAPRAKAA